jgi:ribose transport system ATP-binding protein
VVMVSSEIPEVLGLADRVLVVADGEVLTEAPAGELDEHRVLDLVMESAAAHAGTAPTATQHEGDVA